jgi:hypothetical protein
MKIKTILLLTALSGFSFFAKCQSTWPENLVITPEKSNFLKTSTYWEVMSFIDAIKTKSGNIHVTSMGNSPEGKSIPMVIMANPIVRNPEEARASQKPVIYVQGNIHAGEVEGKEALMMMMRDILLGDKGHLLNNQIIIFAPIYNTDSNDRMEKGRRPSQEDSPLEVGIRENSKGLDLNRDGIKVEAAETQALMRSVIVPWDPQLFVDLHTTNGTWHAYSLTWAPSYFYAGEPGTTNYTTDVMMNEITNVTRDRYGLLIHPYGDYDISQGWPVKKFYTYNHHPRYLINQFSLRNRMAILSEAFSHERFYQRIYSTYTFVSEILEYTHWHAKEIIAVNKKAEEAAIMNVSANAGKVKKGVRFRMDSATLLNRFRTYDYVRARNDDGSEKLLRTGNIINVDSVTYYAKFTPVVESVLPRGYVIPAAFSSIAEHLKSLGVKVQTLSKSQSFEGEIFKINAFEKSSRRFEGHFMATANGEFSPAKRKFKKGDYLIDLAQPLANLIFYMLEPQSDDGLLTWNFFDSYLEEKGIANLSVEYPVFKYIK